MSQHEKTQKKEVVCMRKITTYFVALTIILPLLTIGNTMSTLADSWTLVDSKTASSTSTYLKGVTGEDAKICLKNQLGGIRVNVYHQDGSSGFGSLILNSVFIGNNRCITFDASPYMDGTNNDAQFVVVTTRTPISSYTLELWD